MERFTSVLIAFLLLCGVALPSVAYTEYTYQTDILPWESSLVNSEDYPEPPLVDGGEFPSFGFSFLIPDNALSADSVTHFALSDIDVWINEAFFGWYDHDLASSSSGSVGINPDGSLAFWELVFSLNEIVTPDSPPTVALRDYKIDILSAGGADTCNCDHLNNRSNALSQRPYNTWIVAATVENNFRDASDVNNWSATAVPAPAAWLLVISSLAFLMWRRDRNVLR